MRLLDKLVGGNVMSKQVSHQQNRLDFLQNNIMRMSKYSLILKGWCVTLTLIFLMVLIATKELNLWYWIIPLPIIFCSWGVDAHLFRLKSVFCTDYDKLARGAWESGAQCSTFLNIDSLCASSGRNRFFNSTIWPIYSATVLMVVASALFTRHPEPLSEKITSAQQNTSLLAKASPVDLTSTAASSLTPISFEDRFAQIMREATAAQRYAFLYALPKGADLHNHLNLSILPEAWFQAAASAGQIHGNIFYTRTRLNNCKDVLDPPILYRTIQNSSFKRLSACQRAEFEPLASLSPPTKKLWLSALKLDRPGEGRDEFFEVLSIRLGDLGRDPYLVTDLLVDNMKRFGAEGVRYLEVQIVGPKFLDVAGVPIEEEQAVKLLRDRLTQPDARGTKVTVRFLASVVRFLPGAEQDLERAFARVSRHRDLWVGVNLTGREDRQEGRADRFLGTFRKLRRTYGDVSLALHGGESDLPGLQIRETLLLGATRLGHALNLSSDPATLLLMRDGNYLIETNLISNHLLGYVPDLSVHPFPEYLRTGIPVCLNTDDRGAFDSSLTDEYYTAMQYFNLRWDELISLGRNSLRFSFAEPALKAELLQIYEKSVQQFEDRYRLGDWRDAVTRDQAIFSGYARRTWNGMAIPR